MSCKGLRPPNGTLRQTRFPPDMQQGERLATTRRNAKPPTMKTIPMRLLQIEALAEPLASPACGGRHEGFCK